MREELLKLAERVEQLSGPDREVDALIWLEVTPGATRKETRFIHKASGKEQIIDETRDASRRMIIVPNYTASLDAAMALVPEGCDVMMGRPPARRRVNQIWAQVWDARTSETRNESVGCNLAAALCAAALRALAKEK